MRKKTILFIVIVLILLVSQTIVFGQEFSQPIIHKYGFGQDDQNFAYSFIIENPNTELMLTDVAYSVAVFDESGVVVESESSYIDQILPGQTLGISDEIYLDDGVVVASIQIQVKADDYEMSDENPITISNIHFSEDDYSSYVSGILLNPYDEILKSARINAILYDVNDNIIGGGYTYLNFALANSEIGTEASTTYAGEVDHAELYAVKSYFSDNTVVGDAKPIEILKYGFGQDDYSLGVGFIISNPNQAYAIEDSYYQITSFTSDGYVIDTEYDYIDILYPNQTIGIADEPYLLDGYEVASIDIQILNGDFVAYDTPEEFTVDNISIQVGDYSSKVTGQISNPYAENISDLVINVIVYDENDEIIGSGYTYLDFILGNSISAVDPGITFNGVPARAEIYPQITSWTEFE